MKNKTFYESIKCAVNGLICGLKSEKNFRYYFFIALFFLVMNIICKIDFYGYLIYIIATGGVFSAEFINTAIEKLSDTVSTQIRNDIKLVKDIAAAGVIVWGIVFFAAEFLMIGKCLL